MEIGKHGASSSGFFHPAQVTSSAFPCTRCGLVAFCGATCAEVAWKEWHGSECLDTAGNPLEPALSGLSSECRLALRAVRRNLLEETSEQSTISSTGVARRSSTLPSGTPSSSECDGKLAMGFNDLQEHYTGRSPRQQELLETEVAIAAVLAIGGGRRSGLSNSSVNGPGNRSIEESSGSLAAKLATALVKVTCKSACWRSRCIGTISNEVVAPPFVLCAHIYATLSD